MYNSIEKVLNSAEQFDKDCLKDNFQTLTCRECPVNEACHEIAKEKPNHLWPAEMLAALQARLEEEREEAAKASSPDSLRRNGVSFDVALPHYFWEEVCEKAGQNPFGLIFWAYLPGDHFGRPVAVHAEGVKMLEEAGYEQPPLSDIFVGEDPDQPGKFYFTLRGEGSEISYGSRKEAFKAAWETLGWEGEQ